MQITTQKHRTPSVPPFRKQLQQRLWIVAILAGSIATVIDRLIAMLATPIVYAPVDYPSFSWLPLWAGCLSGAIGATVVFVAFRRSNRPLSTFYKVSAGVLLVSFILPIMPLVIPMSRFAGVNLGIAVTLMVIHTVTASVIVLVLTAYGGTQPGL